MPLNLRALAIKSRFCKMAEKMVEEEATGIGAYEKTLETLAEWHNTATDPEDKAEIRALVPWMEEARVDERKHESRWAIILATTCHGESEVYEHE